MINKCHTCTVLSFFLIKRIQIYFCQFIINIINLDTYVTADGNKNKYFTYLATILNFQVV